MERIRALTKLCLAQIEIIDAQKELHEAKTLKQRKRMQVLAGRMKSSIVILRLSTMRKQSFQC